MTNKKRKNEDGAKRANAKQPEVTSQKPTPVPKRAAAPAKAPKVARENSPAQARERRRLEVERDARQAAARRLQGLATRKLVVAAAMVGVSFLAAYTFAASQGQAGAAGVSLPGLSALSGSAAQASTTIAGNVQKISVDTSAGSFNPGAIKAKAGIPIEITFSKSSGGCLSGVYFPKFNINEDLSAGPKTVTIPAQQKGQYQFFCQMQMVSGTLTVE